MIIGIDASRANRTHKSGTEWYSYYLIKYFAQLDSVNQFILYTDVPLSADLADLSSINGEQEKKDFKPEYDQDGFQILKSPHHNFKAKVLHWPWSYFWTLGRLSLEMLFAAPDVLFIPAHGIPLIHPKKTINTIHDVAFKREAALYQDDKLGPEKGRGSRVIKCIVRLITLGKYGANSTDYLDWSTAFSLRHSQKIITVSQFTRDEIMKLYRCLERKITVIHDGYNNLLYRPITDQNKIAEVLNKYGIARPYLLYVGRLEKKKNTPLLLEAFVKLKRNRRELKEKLVLIGDASYGSDEIKYIIHEFGLEKDVVMPGWVSELDVPYIFNAAVAYISPSLHEGFGITILQALACGVPAAVSDIPVMREVAGEAVLFFNPHDKNDMAAAMEKIIFDEQLRKDLIRRGLARATEFSWEKCARETLQVIEGK